MSQGIAIARSEIPVDLIERHGLDRRVHSRGGEAEVRFLWTDDPPLLPIRCEGSLRVVRWGSRDQASRLPRTGWTWKTTVEGGGWNALRPLLVAIPANFGVDKGVWFRVRQGIQGVLVDNENGIPVVYMICEPATRYYRVMTRSERMPALIDEVI